MIFQDLIPVKITLKYKRSRYNLHEIYKQQNIIINFYRIKKKQYMTA